MDRPDAPVRWTRKLDLYNARNADMQYWNEVWKSDGFDIDHLDRTPAYGLRVFKCDDEHKDYPVVVKLYAQLGIYWYNQDKGTKLRFRSVEKYNRYYRYMPSWYFITSVVEDPDSGSCSHFQTCIREIKSNSMYFRCDLARPKPQEAMHTLFYNEDSPRFLDIRVPEWPSTLDDQNKYYEVQKSDWEWIRLYLELAFVTTNRHIHTPKLSDLKILKVVVETKDIVESRTSEILVKGNATVYIMYEHDLGEGQVLQHTAIVTTTVDPTTGRFCLVGKVSK